MKLSIFFSAKPYKMHSFLEGLFLSLWAIWKFLQLQWRSALQLQLRGARSILGAKWNILLNITHTDMAKTGNPVCSVESFNAAVNFKVHVIKRHLGIQGPDEEFYALLRKMVLWVCLKVHFYILGMKEPF